MTTKSEFDVDESLTDLKQVLEEKNNDKTIYKIWYGDKNTSDTGAANRLSHINNVLLRPVQTKKHNPIRIVMRSGVFKEEVINFLTGENND